MYAKTVYSGAHIPPPTNPSPTQASVSSNTSASAEPSPGPSPFFSCHSSSSETAFPHAIIPPSHPARTLVLCFQSGSGLGDQHDHRNSNVYRFFNLLHSSEQQMCFHDLAEECAETSHETYRDRVYSLKIIADRALALNLDSDVMSGYQDLMYYYRPGDKVCLFGFSRGAYVARALAEMVHKVGLIPRDKAPWYPRAYSLYLREVDGEWHDSYAKFKEEANPINISIDFVGVWDTVSSVGDVLPYTLPFSRSNTSIRVFRQALALHDRWAHLHPMFFEPDAQDAQGRTDVQEVWFAGSHRDIGGCAAPHDAPHSLGHIPLRWMVRECFRANTGIQFQTERLRDIGIDPASLYPIVKERPTPLQPLYCHLNTIALRVPVASEEEHDVRDSLSLMHDQLTVYSPVWWALELNAKRRCVPLGPPSEWTDLEKSRKSVRMKHPRGLFASNQHPHFYIHPSVYTRKQAKHLLREPKASQP